MIPKRDILEAAERQNLFHTTVEKDYVLGWVLWGISQDPVLSRWIFKGGTCLKKCFFETYRFSEDLDFTVMPDGPLDEDVIAAGLSRVADSVEEETGLKFPRDGIEVEPYENPHGNTSYTAKLFYDGPLRLPRSQRQRIKFDVTQDELVADSTELRSVHHPYRDCPESPFSVRTYSVNEILAEKTRALYQRHGRARDVYDVIHVSRNFHESVDRDRALDAARRKFEYKALPDPSVSTIVGRIDTDALRANWQQQLRHQLPMLPPVDDFLAGLEDELAWWLEPATAKPLPDAISTKAEESPVPRQMFPVALPGLFGAQASSLERIRYAARNRLCAHIMYDGRERLVEPYSLRYPKTGNTLLYVHEREKEGRPTGRTKSYDIGEIERVVVSDTPFVAQYRVEL